MKIDVLAVSSGAVVGFLSYSLLKIYAGPRFYQLELQPRLSRTVRGFLFGHLIDYVDKLYGRGIILTDRAWTKNKDKAAATRFLHIGFILSANPADMDWVLNVNQPNYPKSSSYNIFKRILGNGLITQTNQETHIAHRKELMPAFAPAALKDIADFCVPQHAVGLVAALREQATSGRPFVARDAIAAATFNIMAQAAFKCIDEQSLQAVGGAFLGSMSANWSFLRLSPLLDKALIWGNRTIAHHKATLAGIVDQMSERVLRESDEGIYGGRKTLIDYLLQSSKLNHAEIADHSITFLLAGFDTTSNALNWLTYQMAKNPECQERLFEELSSVLALGAVPYVDDLRGCRYLFNVLRESQRCINTIGGVLRDAIVDDVLPGTKQFVPAGQPVYICLHAMHVHPDIWGPDAGSFVPERWERPETEAIAERAFIPFSHGRRNCIGKDFAMNEMKVLAAAMMRNFKLIWPEGEPEPGSGDTPIVQPDKPFHILWVPRTQ